MLKFSFLDTKQVVHCDLVNIDFIVKKMRIRHPRGKNSGGSFATNFFTSVYFQIYKFTKSGWHRLESGIGPQVCTWDQK